MSEESPKDQASTDLIPAQAQDEDVATPARPQGIPGKWIVVGLMVIAALIATGTYLLMHSEHGIAIKAPVEIPEASNEAP